MPQDDDPFKLLVDAVAQTQGTSSVVYHILMELMIKIAETQPDPPAYLRSTFEAISAKLDQASFETEQKAASGFGRETLSTFFSVAEASIRHKKAQPSSDQR
jgi:hypothetical protein